MSKWQWLFHVFHIVSPVWHMLLWWLMDVQLQKQYEFQLDHTDCEYSEEEKKRRKQWALVCSSSAPMLPSSGCLIDVPAPRSYLFKGKLPPSLYHNRVTVILHIVPALTCHYRWKRKLCCLSFCYSSFILVTSLFIMLGPTVLWLYKYLMTRCKIHFWRLSLALPRVERIKQLQGYNSGK